MPATHNGRCLTSAAGHRRISVRTLRDIQLDDFFSGGRMDSHRRLQRVHRQMTLHRYCESLRYLTGIWPDEM